MAYQSNSGGGIKKPSVEVGGGTLEPARLPLGKAVGVRWTKKFSAGGKLDSKKTAIEEARKMMREGIEGEDDIFSKVSTTMRKQAKDRFKEGLKRYEKSDEKIREKEAYDFAGYKKGGKVKKYQAGGMTTAGNALTNLNVTNPAQNPDPFAISYNQQQQSTPNVMEGNSNNVNVGTSQEASNYMYRRGGKVKAYKSGGAVKASSASKRGDGCAIRGKTKGRMV